MFSDKADQCDQANLRVDVHGCRTPSQCDQGTTNGEWYRDHDNQRISERFKLNRQHQEDDRQR
ncbi:Uncharacterised protein [Vibrio cholerae]|nr:Uncharacterised protein [Vibrio cholerae]CSC16465.1 Uncharacterised protein [Vibrio cholerae]